MPASVFLTYCSLVVSILGATSGRLITQDQICQTKSLYETIFHSPYSEIVSMSVLLAYNAMI